ncbi:hypothetical protein BAC_A0214 (plasmid) [Bacillus anthracis str. A0488]|nr:hypothetical protein BAMEG_A0041 [Bacillus anthracis str. CDC 684]ACQ51088.1 hypothetical protein BAA_A0042 [Bacillus anthracis str. A0248]EDR16336.1 hypothetical protein BAC_A0214 [Bacillus anthracis str. A0488]EDR85289.1 hypothetical protein BAQ_A0078 [Bacillus anthracis str. A0193]EDR90532.1 hypothetical protein BAH_A0228 [Bacillus anthracis str. A0442]EDS94385.1 hypothetical protein BAK_A0169 [Bacillus anthracis str. A0389]EDT16968.1 hypothetical protein BAM_A0075 [Bacillus anthracis s
MFHFRKGFFEPISVFIAYFAMHIFNRFEEALFVLLSS